MTEFLSTRIKKTEKKTFLLAQHHIPITHFIWPYNISFINSISPGNIQIFICLHYFFVHDILHVGSMITERKLSRKCYTSTLVSDGGGVNVLPAQEFISWRIWNLFTKDNAWASKKIFQNHPGCFVYVRWESSLQDGRILYGKVPFQRLTDA